MKYLIGEIGFSLLVAGLIGLIVGWLINQFIKSRALSRNTYHYEGALQDREREISRLRSELHSGRGERGGARGNSSRDHSGYTADGARRASSRHLPRDASVGGSKQSPGPQSASGKSTQSTSASGRSGVSARPGIKSTRTTETRTTETRTTETIRRPAIGQPGKYSVAAKGIRGDSASLSVPARSENTKELKRQLDDEAYSKVKALAALGERDRQLQYSYNHAPATKTSNSDVAQYQKLLEQKNTQVDDLQRKVRDLLAAQSKSSAASTAASGATSMREKQLKTNYEIESYEKVRAFAGWGEAERKLSLMQPEAPAPDLELAPLRRRAEQQESIIVDLRKRLEMQQKQSEDARRNAEKKYSLLQRQNETDIATLRADVGDDSARVEVDSYKRKVSDLELAGQNRICLLYTSPSPRDATLSRMPSSA